ncbi:Protein ARV [Entamoeba marina]
MSTISNTDSMKCIECGKDVTGTYEVFCGQFIRLKRCPHCGEVCDKYIEYDNVLVFLDLFLQKPKVFKHLLFNHDQSINSFFIKLFFGSLILESYIRQMTIPFPSMYTFIANGIQMIIEDIIFLTLFVVTIPLFRKISISDSIKIVCQSLVIGSLGKVLLCLVLMWDNSMSIYLFSLAMSNLTYAGSLGSLLNMKPLWALTYTLLLCSIFTLITYVFMPVTPITYFVKTHKLFDLLKGEIL